jgi:hypothetical protein
VSNSIPCMDFCNFNERQQFGLSSMRQKIECKSKCHWHKNFKCWLGVVEHTRKSKEQMQLAYKIQVLVMCAKYKTEKVRTKLLQVLNSRRKKQVCFKII